MKVAIDVSPLKSGHKVRGVGFYLNHLKYALDTYYPEHSYVYFEDKNEIPSDVDVIHYPYFDPFTFTQPLVKTKPTVITVHDLTPIKFPEHFPAGFKGNVKWNINKKFLKITDAIITDSFASKKDIVDLSNISTNKVNVVHLAAGEQFKKIVFRNGEKVSLQKKYNLPDQFMLYVGDVTWNKNLPRLLEAVIETKFPLVMVGKALQEVDYDKTHPWNKDLVRVQELVKAHKNISALGFVNDEDLISLYNLATVLLFPSIYEGFGFPILEAMACGTPVITSKGGAMEEVAGDAAYLVDSESVDSIKDGIVHVFKNDKVQEELIRKGMKRVEEFTWEETARQTVEVYKKIVKNHA